MFNSAKNKFFVLSFILSFLSAFVSAQRTIKIEYEKEFSVPRQTQFSVNGSYVSIPPPQPLGVRLLVNDSFAFIHYFSKDLNPLKKKAQEFGKKLFHHGYFYDLKKNKQYALNNFPKNNKYLILIDSLNPLKWQFLDEEKYIAGFKCSAALSITNKNDSILVWYSNELPNIGGFEYYTGVPWLILEVYDQRYSGSHIIAKKVEETDIKLFYPQEGEIISLKEFRSLRQKEKDKKFQKEELK